MKRQMFTRIAVLVFLLSVICFAQVPPAPVPAVPGTLVTPVAPPAPVPAVPGSAAVTPTPVVPAPIPAVPASPPVFNISSTPTEKEVTLPVVNIPVANETTYVTLGIVTDGSGDTTHLIIPITAGQKTSPVVVTPVAPSTPKTPVSKVTPVRLVTLDCDSLSLDRTVSEVSRVTGVDVTFLRTLSLTPAEISRVVSAFNAVANEDGQRGVEKFTKRMEKEFDKLNRKGKNPKEIIPVAVSSGGFETFLTANTICAMAEQFSEPNRIEMARQLKAKVNTYSRGVLIGLAIGAFIIGLFLGRATKKGGGGEK